MKIATCFALTLAALLSVSCSKSETPAAPAALTLDDILPKHAQPKLPTMKIYLGAETLDAELALTEQQEMTGMMFRTNIQDSDAMIFVLPQPQRANFWMKNCPESISAAYITGDGVIQEIHHLEKNDTNGVVAARLATSGFHGAADPFEAPDGGFFALTSKHARPELLTDELGVRLRLADTCIKNCSCSCFVLLFTMICPFSIRRQMSKISISKSTFSIWLGAPDGPLPLHTLVYFWLYCARFIADGGSGLACTVPDPGTCACTS